MSRTGTRSPWVRGVLLGDPKDSIPAFPLVVTAVWIVVAGAALPPYGRHLPNWLLD
jgi:hypothetical protein